jgi:succinate dehydrogenase / fumarate reductase, cytochrome b subunit
MASFAHFLRSTILSKVVMAVTGVVLVLFLCGHMAGNMQMYLGQDRMNHYAETLQGMGALLWVIRCVLLLCLVLHVWTSIRLKFLNMEARPVAYVRKNWVKATLTSRTMLWTGALVGSFLLYHILHFTLGSIDPSTYHVVDPKGRHDVYSMVVLGYKNILVSASYLVAMLLLGFHLNHAIASAFQTLGINHPKYNPFIHGLSVAVSVIVALGFLSVPGGVLLGFIQLPAGVVL